MNTVVNTALLCGGVGVSGILVFLRVTRAQRRCACTVYTVHRVTPHDMGVRWSVVRVGSPARSRSTFNTRHDTSFSNGFTALQLCYAYATLVLAQTRAARRRVHAVCLHKLSRVGMLLRATITYIVQCSAPVHARFVMRTLILPHTRGRVLSPSVKSLDRPM